MKRYEATRRTLWAEIIKIAVGPILIAALWSYWLFEYLPFPMMAHRPPIHLWADRHMVSGRGVPAH